MNFFVVYGFGCIIFLRVEFRCWGVYVVATLRRFDDGVLNEDFARVVGVKFGDRPRRNSDKLAVVFRLGLRRNVLRLLYAPRYFVIISFANNECGLEFRKGFYHGRVEIGHSAISSGAAAELGSVGAEVLIHRFCRFPGVSSYFVAGREGLVDGDCLCVAKKVFYRFARFYHFTINTVGRSLRGPTVGFSDFVYEDFVRATGSAVVVGRFVGCVAKGSAFEAVNCVGFVFWFEAWVGGRLDRLVNDTG